MLRWLLPESIEDLLPHEAAQIERMRRRLLDLFASFGFELVQPPLLEYVESLVTNGAHDLDLRTFKLVDQLSGRMMGVRADITPQVARIDAHLLNRKGVTRLCYCHSVLHTLPASLTATREPIQLGVELYGHAGLEADAEVIRLMAQSLESVGVGAARIDIGHVGIFRALTQGIGLDAVAEEALFDVLQAKDKPTLALITAGLPDEARRGLMALPDLYGPPEVLDEALKVLPARPDIQQAVASLRDLVRATAGLPVSIDLADLRGYHYHTGVVFAAYCDQHPAAMALGGRYDNIGAAFGRARPATGFSLDLRDVANYFVSRVANRAALQGLSQQALGAVLAPLGGDPGLAAAIADLRRAGEVVVMELPGHDGTWREAGCDRRLTLGNGAWQVVSL